MIKFVQFKQQNRLSSKNRGRPLVSAPGTFQPNFILISFETTDLRLISISRVARRKRKCLIFTPRIAMHFNAKRGIEIACRLSVRLSVCPTMTLVDQDHIGWKSWQLHEQLAQHLHSSQPKGTHLLYSQGNMGKFGGE